MHVFKTPIANNHCAVQLAFLMLYGHDPLVYVLLGRMPLDPFYPNTGGAFVLHMLLEHMPEVSITTQRPWLLGIT